MRFACDVGCGRRVARCATSVIVLVVAQACSRGTAAATRSTNAHAASIGEDSLQASRDSALRIIAKRIAGRESMAADSVFMNLRIAFGISASRLPQLMNSMARSLGVTCSFCHDLTDYASDAKPQKSTARRMYAMMRSLNGELLPRALDRAPSANQLVTCATCHRGNRRPATELPR